VSFAEAADLLRGGHRLRDRWQRAKFKARAYWQATSTKAYLQCLASPFVSPLWSQRPRLAMKLQRPYVHARWTVADRLAALSAHYEALASLVSRPKALALYRDGLTLVRLQGETKGRSYAVRLAYQNEFEAAGELTLSVVDVETGTALANLTFTLVDQANVRTLCIGGIQAGTEPWSRALVQTAGKELFGLRPKALALWCVRHLARVWAIERITAVSDSRQTGPAARRRGEAPIPHDAFWQESGGSLQTDGTWELPLEVPRRALGVMSDAQAEAYRARYAFLDRLAPHLLAAAADLNGEDPLETRAVAIAGTGSALSSLSIPSSLFTGHPF